jgi:hypothetical protein
LINADADTRNLASCGSADLFIARVETGLLNVERGDGELDEDRLLRRYSVPWIWLASPQRQAEHEAGLGICEDDFAAMYEDLSVRLVTSFMFVAGALGEHESGSESVRLLKLATELMKTYADPSDIESSRQLTIDHDIDYLDEPE